MCVCIYLCVFLVAQSCLALCGPMDCSLPDSSVRGIFQARILEWVAFFHSMGSSGPRFQACVFCVSSISGRFLTTIATWEAPKICEGISGVIIITAFVKELPPIHNQNTTFVRIYDSHTVNYFTY